MLTSSLAESIINQWKKDLILSGIPIKTRLIKKNTAFHLPWHSVLSWIIIVLFWRILNTVMMKSDFTVLAGFPAEF